jgi:uncharacterized membrane protein YedE/YeeE
MSEAQLAQLNWMVLASAGLVSLLFGALLHRTHFCTMGAVSDAMVMGSFDRLRQWALALAVAILGFGGLTLSGYISPMQSIYATPSVLWLSTLLGGLMFGWGMVLASGCGAKSLVRAGAGNLKALIVLLVMGISALITLKGILSVPRVHILETFAWSPGQGVFLGQWFSQLAGLELPQGFFAAALLVSLMLFVWVARDRTFLNSSNLVTGVSVGILVCSMWLVSGVLGHGLEHPDTLEEFFLATSSRKMESFSLTAPVALGLDALMYFSDGTKRLTIGMVSVLGIFCGAFFSAKFSGQYKFEAFSNRTDLMRHLAGGFLMGVGGVLAMGCSLGQGLSGMSTLSIASVLATVAMLAGAVFALLNDLRQTA